MTDDELRIRLFDAISWHVYGVDTGDGQGSILHGVSDAVDNIIEMLKNNGVLPSNDVTGDTVEKGIINP